MRLSNPGRIKFRPERYDKQYAKILNPVYDPSEQFQDRGVYPMYILKDHQHWILPCQGLHLGNERFQRSLSALLRGQLVERGIASIVRQRQYLSKDCRVPDWRRSWRKQCIELTKPRLRRVVVRQAGGTLHLAYDRIKRAVRVLRRAEITQTRVRFAGKAF